jgi:hypothetical protein
MKIGTKSVLFGAHCFFLHPFFVAAAWRRLYGFPWDPRLWVAFFVHDLGYWGCPNMDGAEGERHPELGARIMRRWFGKEWAKLVFFHSRHYARIWGEQPSRLCAADKLAFCLTPRWLYLPMVRATGEVWEYMADSARMVKEEPDVRGLENLMASPDPVLWWEGVHARLTRWANEHAAGEADTWTKERNHDTD